MRIFVESADKLLIGVIPIEHIKPHKTENERTMRIYRKAQDKMANKAFNDGITHKQTKGRLHKWVTSLFFKNCNANNIRLYGGYCYIFAGETLVRVIPVPVNLKKDFREM